MPKQTSKSKNDMSNFEKINFYSRSMQNSAWKGSTVVQVVDDRQKIFQLWLIISWFSIIKKKKNHAKLVKLTKIYDFSFFGQRPQRGRSPVEHRRTFVCHSVCLFVPPGPIRPWICPLRPEIYPLRLEICPLRPWIWEGRFQAWEGLSG